MRKWCEDLRRGDHVIHIYRDDDEQAKALLDLIAWMREDERLVLFCDGPDREARESFSLSGHVFEAAAQEGRLEILPSNLSVCPTGKFHPEMIPQLIMREHGRAMDDGFGGLHVGFDCSWITEFPEDLTAHIVQQSEITLSKLPSNLTLLCQYDGRKFSAEQAERLRRVHQLALVDGKLTRNFWVVATSALGGRPQGIRAVPAPGTIATGSEK